MPPLRWACTTAFALLAALVVLRRLVLNLVLDRPIWHPFGGMTGAMTPLLLLPALGLACDVVLRRLRRGRSA